VSRLLHRSRGRRGIFRTRTCPWQQRQGPFLRITPDTPAVRNSISRATVLPYLVIHRQYPTAVIHADAPSTQHSAPATHTTYHTRLPVTPPHQTRATVLLFQKQDRCPSRSRQRRRRRQHQHQRQRQNQALHPVPQTRHTNPPSRHRRHPHGRPDPDPPAQRSWSRGSGRGRSVAGTATAQDETRDPTHETLSPARTVL
jgi:hypothetical protein